MTTTNAPALTPKQRQVLDLLGQGKKPAEIAKKLRISTSGVNGHIRNIRASGVPIPSNGRAAAPPPAAEPAVPWGQDDADSPEASIRAAIAEADHRMSEIDAEVLQLQERIGDLGTERTGLEGRREKLSAALGQLA